MLISHCVCQPDSNCFNSFTLSSVGKVIIGTLSFVSVISNSVIPTAEEITHFLDQVKLRLISKLINGFSRVLQKLLKYFNGTAVLSYFVLPAAGDFPVILILYLKDSDCVTLSFGSYLQYCHKIPDVFK